MNDATCMNPEQPAQPEPTQGVSAQTAQTKDETTQAAPPALRDPCSFWNIISVVTPVLGLPLAWVVMLAVAESNEWAGLAALASAVVLWTGFCLIGLIAAVIALFRFERRRWLTFLGFLFNAPACVGLLPMIMEELLRIWRG